MKNLSTYTIHILVVIGITIILSILILPHISNCDFHFIEFEKVKLGSLLAFYPILSLISERFTQLLISGRSMNKQRAEVFLKKMVTADPTVQKLEAEKEFHGFTLKAGTLEEAKKAISDYSRKTFRLATTISFLTSVLLCLFGFRILSTFITFDAECVHGMYITFFGTLDIILSAALLAGTSDGIHQLTEMLKKTTLLPTQ